MQERSLSLWACVHRAHTTECREVVVKRTAPTRDRTEAMAAWTRDLAGHGIPAVTPVDLAAPNPGEVGEEWWVVYPFVVGRGYDASDVDGDLETLGERLPAVMGADAGARATRVVREPRLFDLAMAVVLFHCESPGAPGRLLTQEEWLAFYGAYSGHVTLTSRERFPLPG